MNPQERNWLQKITESPEDHCLQLVYADWLEDHGDARSALVRLQAKCLQLQKDSPQRLELEQQKLEVLVDSTIVPLHANCIEPPLDDELELAVARLGLPLPRRDDREASPEIARLTCAPFDFTNSIGMRFNLLPAGMFMMGSPECDSDAADREKPQHQVILTSGFHLATTETTQGQWESIMGAKSWSGEEYAKEGANYAANYVSNDDAVVFCRKLSSRENKTYRLPTEAEWEYACRAGTTTRYSFGDSAAQLGDYAWFDGNAWDVDEEYAHVVGQKLANPWGLYDMHGNVDEWCSDWWYRDYGNAAVTNPSGPTSGSRRVYRSGSWGLPPRLCRSANRFRGSPDYRGSYSGFRVSLSSVE